MSAKSLIKAIIFYMTILSWGVIFTIEFITLKPLAIVLIFTLALTFITSKKISYEEMKKFTGFDYLCKKFNITDEEG